MTKQLAKKEEYSKEKIELIKRTVAKGATNDELAMFVYQARRAGLDPLARQIYFIKAGDRVMIQTSIDGFRLVAQRSGDYAGQDEPVFTEKEGQIESCKVSVYKFSPKGERYPAAVGVAYMGEYSKPGGMWQKMPHTMLAKVAEALALRKAFPQDLSGLYTNDEMEQAGPAKPVDDLPDAPVETIDKEPAKVMSAGGKIIADAMNKVKEEKK